MLPVGHIGITLGGLSLAGYERHPPLLVIGAILPDVVDKSVGLLVFGTGRAFAHTFMFVIILAMVGLWYSQALWLSAGSIVHLVQDQMWQAKEVLLWPAFGLDFPARDYSLLGLLSTLSDPSVYIPEIIGLACIAWYVYHLYSLGKLYRVAKRIFDITLSFIGLVVLLPIGLLISIAVFLQDFGPVFFTQNRCGSGMKRFRLIKFRTMKALRKGQSRVIENIKGDNRVTAVGRLLRSTALDSIPELINILKGDMSFVGPRPMPWLIEDERDYTNIGQVQHVGLRSSVIPGLTGVAQIYASKYSTRRTKFRYDAIYAMKANFWLDLRLFAYSVWLTMKKAWD